MNMSYYNQGPPQQGGFPARPAGYDNQTYNNQRPNPPAPWSAEWDTQASAWVFVNQQNGQRTHNFPRPGGGYNETVTEKISYQQQGGYGPPPHQRMGSPQGGYRPSPPPQQRMGSPQGGYRPSPPPQQQQQNKSHAGRNTALAAVGGVLAGGLLMHEGHKVEEKWDEDKLRFDVDKDRMENNFEYGRDRIEDRAAYDRDRFDDRVNYDERRFDDRVDYDQARFDDRVDYDRARFDDRVAYDEDRVADFPDDAARWTGRKVQEVEDIPEDVAGWTGRKVQEVEDIPEDIAGWAGRRVQGFEDFGDDIRDSYDDGRVNQEYRDDQRYDDDRW